MVGTDCTSVLPGAHSRTKGAQTGQIGAKYGIVPCDMGTRRGYCVGQSGDGTVINNWCRVKQAQEREDMVL